MKILDGKELSLFIKERQAKAVRGLRQAEHIIPKLAIIQIKDDPVINTYVRLKKRYGQDILVEVEAFFVDQKNALDTIERLNADTSVHGIIVQLPITDTSETQKICDAVSPEKDVDALGVNAILEPATPMAILWLLAGYGLELNGKKIVLIGNGKLVGAPLAKLLRSQDQEVEVVDRDTDNLTEKLKNADIIITATGSPAILFPEMIKQGAVVVDAGVASEDGKTVGDLHESVYERDDLILTPQKGGVGPLTVCALFENVITAARLSAQTK
ncbi:MAG: bifunctional 5,10-methylenetetrahydrofolate dehydrogenase/5,10-methenyltetrahydrofolate cyclohydrolase [bacterium]|nr:bifunctional 5,10-methylenetetrahydrofolate dehydrogenase/5,10-methenyltetrahydrofolate cyclohydrolase [bacterium]